MQSCFVSAAAVAALLALPSAASAHDATDHAKRHTISTEERPFGVEGDPRKAGRTITLTTDDTMRYSQPQIRVAQGETITFVVTNKGKLLHELVLGTEDGLQRHAETMRKNPGMQHDEPYMTHVKPGATERNHLEIHEARNLPLRVSRPRPFRGGHERHDCRRCQQIVQTDRST